MHCTINRKYLQYFERNPRNIVNICANIYDYFYGKNRGLLPCNSLWILTILIFWWYSDIGESKRAISDISLFFLGKVFKSFGLLLKILLRLTRWTEMWISFIISIFVISSLSHGTRQELKPGGVGESNSYPISKHDRTHKKEEHFLKKISN